MITTSSRNQTLVASKDAQHGSAPSRDFDACVLVVEDDEDMRYMLRTMLELRGINVVEAVNGEMAIALVDNVQIDLVMMDCTMPVLSGFEATRRIRQRHFAEDVPIIFLSGHVQPEYKHKAFAAGCSDYLVKPFSLREIDHVLERHLSRSTAN